MAEETHNDRQVESRMDLNAERSASTGRDPAAESLAAALRISFRILTVIMVLVVAAFLLTGLRRVKSGQVGLRSRFGRIVGTSSPGLRYAWPFPIGHIEMIDLGKRELIINDFWLHESAQEKTVPLSERRIRDKGLKPGWDGALLTADGSLLHMRLACYYSVAEGWDVQTGLNNAVLFRINVDDQPAEQIRGEEESLHSQDILRAVVCRAAILAATTQTAEKLRTNTEDFTNEVEALAQAQLDELKTGLRITNINVASISWPLQIRDQVAEANKARQERETQINNALAEARTLLSRTAGGSFERLAGEVESLVSDRSARQVQQQAELAQEYERAKEAGDYDKVRELLTQFRSAGLVEQYTSARQADDERLAEDILAEMKREERPLIEVYTVAREAGEEQLADELLAMIDEVLLSGGTTGRAQSIIQQARSSRTEIVEPVKGRLSRFKQLLPQYRRDPQFMIDRLWADVRDSILTKALVEKFYVTRGEGTIVVKINRDPRVARAIQHRLLGEQEQDEEE